MHHAIYELAMINGRNTITGTAVMVSIFNLVTDEFTPDPGKLQFYGQHDNKPVAFEAAYEHANLEAITGAIQWYAKYTGNPDMDININDPRPRFLMHVV